MLIEEEMGKKRNAEEEGTELKKKIAKRNVSVRNLLNVSCTSEDHKKSTTSANSKTRPGFFLGDGLAKVSRAIHARTCTITC